MSSKLKKLKRQAAILKAESDVLYKATKVIQDQAYEKRLAQQAIEKQIYDLTKADLSTMTLREKLLWCIQCDEYGKPDLRYEEAWSELLKLKILSFGTFQKTNERCCKVMFDDYNVKDETAKQTWLDTVEALLDVISPNNIKHNKKTVDLGGIVNPYDEDRAYVDYDLAYCLDNKRYELLDNGCVINHASTIKEIMDTLVEEDNENNTRGY